MILRQAQLTDLPYLYEICHQTGASGQDASALLSDRFLLGQYFAAPYLVHDPGWCWVAQDDEGPAGYLVATPHSHEFASWMNSVWLPTLRLQSPSIENPVWTPFETWIRRLFHQKAQAPDFTDQYPAHLHIDFLPRAQGQGLGTRLVGAFLEQLHQSRVPGFHLGVSLDNLKAQSFYRKLGFQEIRRDPGVLFLGQRF